MQGTSCPSRDQLAAYLLGRLGESSAAEAIANHVERCPECDSSLNHLDHIADPLVLDLRGPAPAECAVPVPELAEVMRRAKAIQPIAPEATPVAARAAGVNTDAAHSPTGPTWDVKGETVPEDQIPVMDPPLNRLGECLLLEELGRGGMGIVYKARHCRLKRLVAVKVLSSELVRDAGAVARFRQEVEAVGALAHPNIVHAHDASESNGTHFLVMEYVSGVDLGRLVRKTGAFARQSGMQSHSPSRSGVATRS